MLAPILSFIPALTAWCVIPFGAPLPTRWGRIDLVVADLPVGFLFILAITSLGVYGIVLAGWSSNNKYALLGGLRSSAQMISYEISLGMSTIPVLLLAGNVSLNSIINQQAWGGWNVVNLTVAFFIFMVAAFAETNRLPFDLPEAESELIAGYHTEYSAMKFSLFFIAEYANMVTASALMATLFFGGWDVPFTARDNIGPYSGWLSLLSIGIFLAKILFFLFLFMWVRWTLPRFRYDQLMSLGWKFMLPLALVYIVLIAAVMLGLSAAGIQHGTHVRRDSRLRSTLRLMIVLFAILDRGRIISPAYGRMPKQEIERAAPRSMRVDSRQREADNGNQGEGRRAADRGRELRTGDAQGNGAHASSTCSTSTAEVTTQYPEEKSPISPRWRGTHRMLTTETGKAQCVACGLCPTVCPANCIKLVPGEDEEGNRYPLVFEIDEFRCIFCGYCQEVCPEEAIHVGRHYENAEYSREGFVYDLQRLMDQTHPVCEMWDPEDPKGE